MSTWAQTLLLWSWQSLLLVSFVLIVVRIARAQSAASRHSFWLLTLLVVSILPVINAVVRAWPLEAPAVAPISYIAQIPEATAEAFPAAGQPSTSVRGLVTPSLFAVWIAGALISAIRSLRAHRRWHRIARSALGVERTGSVALGYSTEVEAPVLIGTVRPMIVLPANIETWTSAEERHAVLLHELAHVERRDHWVSPFQAVLGALFFFHPAVRYALRQLILERELACDEHVLSMGTNSSTYAEVILRVAEHSIPGRQSDCPAFNSPGKILERRIEMILSYRSSITGWSFPAIGRAAIVLALASLLLPQRSLIAETPLPPRLEFQVAAFQPLTEAVAAIASAIPTKVAAQPVAPAEEPLHRAATFQPLMESVAAVTAALQVQVPETSFAAISGTVSDPSGALVPGVNVTLIPSNSQEARTTTTNEEGAYVFNRVAPGEWTLQAKTPGFTGVDRKILLRSGEAGAQNVTLAVARIETFVSVSASRGSLPPNPVRPPALPKRIGGAIVQPRLITQLKPVYPASARALGVQDYVQLQAVIGKDGKIISLQIDPNRVGVGNTDLNNAAIDAVQQWRYSPATLNGMAIEMATTITVTFTLE